MADVSINLAGPVLILENNEVTQLLNTGNLPQTAKDILEKAFLLVGIAGTVANIAITVVVAYIQVQRKLIELANQAGCGIYLTLPWPAITLSAISGIPTYLAFMVPTPKPCPPKQPAIPVGQEWSQVTPGSLKTEDPTDNITYVIDHNAVDPNAVAFKLVLSPNSSRWKKTINMPDGEGNSWDIIAEGQNQGENGLWVAQLGNGQKLSFYKAKFLGVMTKVLELGSLQHLQGGDRVTFTWERDS